MPARLYGQQALELLPPRPTRAVWAWRHWKGDGREGGRGQAGSRAHPKDHGEDARTGLSPNWGSRSVRPLPGLGRRTRHGSWPGDPFQEHARLIGETTLINKVFIKEQFNVAVKVLLGVLGDELTKNFGRHEYFRKFVVKPKETLGKFHVILWLTLFLAGSKKLCFVRGL